jgi:hypothetical protein
VWGKAVHVLDKKIKATKFINIKHSEQACPILHDFLWENGKSILLISHCMKRFSIIFLKIEFILIPLLANSHIF